MLSVTSSNVIESLTEDQKTAIIQLALNASEELGYCSESRNVISQMGLEIPRVTTIIMVEIEVEHDFGTELDSCYLDINYTDYDVNAEVVGFTDV